MKKLLVIFMMLFLVGCKKNETELKELTDDMLELSNEAEGVINDYSKMWSFSIESGTAIAVEDMATEMGLDEDTIREYFEINPLGNVTGDFSSNISSLKSYYESTGKLDKLEKGLDDIKERMPNTDNSKAFDEVLDMYAYLKEYIDMALNPSGSLQSFNENKNQLDSDIQGAYNRIEVLIAD